MAKFGNSKKYKILPNISSIEQIISHKVASHTTIFIKPHPLSKNLPDDSTREYCHVSFWGYFLPCFAAFRKIESNVCVFPREVSPRL